MDPNNCFSTVNNNLKSNLLKIFNEIKNTNFIPSRKGKEVLMCKIKELYFIQS